MTFAIGSLLGFLGGCQKEAPTIHSIAVHPNRPDILYLSTDKGLYKTTDGGVKWNLLREGLGTFQILSLAINPAIPSTLYAGTFSDGVYRSTDGGRNWMLINNGMKDYIAVVNAIAINPQNPDVLYAGTTMGAYRSRDNGGSWERISTGLDSLYVVSLVINPKNPDLLYAGTSGGIYRTNNGGMQWSASNKGLMVDMRISAMSLGVNSIAFDPKDPAHLYTGTAKGLYQSRDGGSTWKRSDQGIDELFVTAVAPAPAENGQKIQGADDPAPLLYAGTNRALYQSRDGERWEKILEKDISAITFDPQRSEVLYIGTGNGIFRSEDRGKSWTEIKMDR